MFSRNRLPGANRMGKAAGKVDEKVTGKTAGKNLLAALIAAGLAASSFWGCEGSATQTTNGQKLTGTLVDKSGHPVSGAMVNAWPSGAILLGNPQSSNSAPAASGETDAQGRYALTELAAGEYNVFGEQGHGVASVLIPRVSYLAMELDLGVDTLTPPGTIIGKVMANGKPMAGVFCYLPGSARVTMTDSLGIFALDRVPAGSYKLAYTSAGYATVIDSPVVVVSAGITALPTKVLAYDIALQPPTPESLSASLNAMGYVVLTWKKPAVADLAGYILQVSYTGDTANEYFEESEIFDKSMLPDTSTISIYKLAWYVFYQGKIWVHQDTGTVTFRIKALDKDGNKSAAFSDPVSIVVHRSPLHLFTTSLVEGGSTDAAPRCRDTLTFVSTFTSTMVSAGTIRFHIEGWYHGSTESVIAYTDKSQVWNGKVDTLVWYPGRAEMRNIDEKPAEMDSATWFNGGGIVFKVPQGKPDSLRVAAYTGLQYDVEYLSKTTVMDIRVDSQGCYKVSPARIDSTQGVAF